MTVMSGIFGTDLRRRRAFYRSVRGMYQKLPVRVMTSDTGKSIRIPSRTASVVHQNPFSDSCRIYGTYACRTAVRKEPP